MKIDLNCDVGEGVGNEAILMPLISSCNISCGAHAGSIDELDKVLRLAKEHGVKVGAHPSYPDRENFGREIMDISKEALQDSIINQLQLFKQRADRVGVSVHHVKPHGALYNVSAVNREIAAVVIQAITAVFDSIKLYTPYGSVLLDFVDNTNIEIVYEAFADRNYNEDLSLVSRKLPNAVLTDEGAIITHVQLMCQGKVKIISGALKEIKATTFCVHGDNEHAIEIIKRLNAHFA